MLDYEYICQKISDMAGLPVRVYRNRKPVYFYCFIELAEDPAVLVIDDLLSKTNHIDYLVTDNADYYGILNCNDLSIIIGPSFSQSVSDQQLRKLAFDLQVNVSQIDDYVASLKTLVKMPLNSILQILCTLNYVFNNEKTSINDIPGFTSSEIYLPESESSQADVYRSLNIENTISGFIESGDMAGFEQWMKQAPTVKEGKVADDYLRQNKNIFIISTTIFSRSAIKAGLDPEKALRISDTYIQQCESLSSTIDISNLQIRMIKEYIESVHSTKNISNNNYLAKKIYNLVVKNISTNISTAYIAKELGYSRSYLSTAFKKENNIELSKYIQNIRINEAKKLLTETDNSLASIAYYLGYSSSSHFNNDFKKVVGTTPNVYRNKSKGLV